MNSGDNRGNDSWVYPLFDTTLSGYCLKLWLCKDEIRYSLTKLILGKGHTNARHSSFPAIHKVGNVGIFELLKFGNQGNYSCQIYVILIQSTTSNEN